MTRASWRAVSLVAVLLAAGTGVRAQQVAAPTAGDTSRFAAAQRFLAASGAAELMIAAVRANIPIQRRTTPQLPPEFWTEMEARVVAGAADLTDSIAVVYAATFTRAELDELTAFYLSPAGRRLRAAQPALVAQSAEVGQRWGERLGMAVADTLRARGILKDQP